MEIRCEKCSHVGPAAALTQGSAGILLTCEHCGHQNLLRTAPASAQPTEPGAHTPSPPADTDGSAAAAAPRDPLVAMIPAPGPGPRCRKCGHLLNEVAPADASTDAEVDDNCPRCGLNQAEAAKYAPGEAPWERAPAGKEEQFAQAERLWHAAASQQSQGALDPQRLQDFVAFTGEEDLLDLGIRRLRMHLIDFPEDAHALAALRTLAERMQARVVVATAQAQADAQLFEDKLGRLQRRLMLAAGVLAIACLAIFLVFYMR